jgi:uncharacterized protein YifE (UPF0438 family)
MHDVTESGLPPDHRHFLEQRPFPFGCSTHIFPPDELAALNDHGNWMQALAAGTIQPTTPEHEHFLLVDRDDAKPLTVDERAWIRLKGRREFEREQETTKRPTASEDFGIIEWDREKCWW